MAHFHDIYESPMGPLVLEGDGEALSALSWPKRDGSPQDLQADSISKPDSFLVVRRQLDEFFAGNRREFDVSLRPQGTPFQLQVWQELRNIPFGTTISYGELATRIGKPKASRAVGGANGKNPISLIVP